MEDFYSTEDFYEAAYLVYQNFPIVEQKLQNNLTLFIFKSSPELQGEITAYFTQTTKVEPRRYGSTIRSLKTMIHNNRDKFNKEQGE
jgi:hypothetical protein